jgi:undecaprenyl-diphosphatase
MIDNAPVTSVREAPQPRRLGTVSLSVLGLLVLALLVLTGEWKVVVLGIVEGVTEFLPISSTGHLLLASELLAFEHSLGGTFEIFIQLGAVLAVVGYYARDLLTQARMLPSSAATRRFWLAILVAFLPAAIVGLLVHDWIKQVLFESPAIIATSLIAGGIVFLLVDRRETLPAAVHDVESIGPRQALGIGVAQVLALVPGVSRSGASIIGGMLAGLDRRAATAFSFYLAIPTLGAATIVDLLGSLDQLAPGDLGRLLLGALVAMIVAWLSIGWLLRYVAHHSFRVFGIYRIAAGLIILALVAAGLL